MIVDLVAAELDRVHERIAGRFARAEPRSRVREYVSGLVAGLERKNGWTLAEWAGEVSPDGMQRLLRRADWNVDGVRDDVRGYVVEQLGDPDGVLIADLCRSWNYAEARAARRKRRLMGRPSGGGWGCGARHNYRLSRKASSGS